MTTLERRSAGPRVGIRSARVRYDTNRLLARFRPGHGRPCPLVDLSRGGIQFLSTEGLERGTKLRVYLDVPAILEPIAVDAKVVWSRPVESKGFHRVGVRIDSDAPEAIVRILRDDSLRHRERSAFLR